MYSLVISFDLIFALRQQNKRGVGEFHGQNWFNGFVYVSDFFLPHHIYSLAPHHNVSSSCHVLWFKFDSCAQKKNIIIYKSYIYTATAMSYRVYVCILVYVNTRSSLALAIFWLYFCRTGVGLVGVRD